MSEGTVTGGAFSFEHAGLAAIARRVTSVVSGITEKVGAELYKLGQEIMTDSKRDYVPVDTGVLRGSGFVEQPKREHGSIIVRLGYGGASAAYALAVHEHLSSHSPYSWRKAEAEGRRVQFSPSGMHGPKYLERPVLAKAHLIPVRCAPVLEQAAAAAQGSGS